MKEQLTLEIFSFTIFMALSALSKIKFKICAIILLARKPDEYKVFKINYFLIGENIKIIKSQNCFKRFFPPITIYLSISSCSPPNATTVLIELITSSATAPADA